MFAVKGRVVLCALWAPETRGLLQVIWEDGKGQEQRGREGPMQWEKEPQKAGQQGPHPRPAPRRAGQLRPR